MMKEGVDVHAVCGSVFGSRLDKILSLQKLTEKAIREREEVTLEVLYLTTLLPPDYQDEVVMEVQYSHDKQV